MWILKKSKIILAKAVSEIHDTKLKHINELINKNLKRFNNNYLINLKMLRDSNHSLLQIVLTKIQISKANDIFFII